MYYICIFTALIQWVKNHQINFKYTWVPFNHLMPWLHYSNLLVKSKLLLLMNQWRFLAQVEKTTLEIFYKSWYHSWEINQGFLLMRGAFLFWGSSTMWLPSVYKTGDCPGFPGVWGKIGCSTNIFSFKLKFLFDGGDELELPGFKSNCFFLFW